MSDDEFKIYSNLIFNKFDYDITNNVEIKVLAYLCAILVDKHMGVISERLIDDKISHINDIFDDKINLLNLTLDQVCKNIEKQEYLSDSFQSLSDESASNVSLMIKESTKSILKNANEVSEVIKKKSNEELTESMNNLKILVQKTLSNDIKFIVQDAVISQLITENNPLKVAAKNINKVNNDTIKTASLLRSILNKSISRQAIVCIGSSVFGTAITFLLLMVMQNLHWINVPINISLDTSVISEHIIKSMKK
ncbi:hypothetical protein ABLA30_13570 [Xenorhabdus nematophila]|uniref:hypothetical protein n=1 Tax=Xenorhabdus nematophila TaxID=628 RepID=UPI0032B761FC